MKKADTIDKTKVISILTNAFENNRSVNFVVRKDKHRVARIEALMDYAYELSQLFGEVWLSDNDKGCALVLYPHKKTFSIRSLWLDVRLVLKAIGVSGIARTLRREAQIRRIQSTQWMTYIWFIGVDRPFQRQGIGTQLLQEIIKRSDHMNLPLYLETSDPENLRWYQSFGFKIYHRLPLGYSLFFLRRPDQ